MSDAKTKSASVAKAITVPLAVAAARDAAQIFTDLPVDQISACERNDGGWRVVVDLVENKARAGRNDLIVSFAVALDQMGEAVSFQRLGRYYREDHAKGMAAS
ncbi:MAG: gas vesicle protein GvpO [Pseudomonadota bacterium]